MSRWEGDKWDEAANLHLLRHIRRACGRDPRCYGDFGLLGIPGHSRPPTAAFQLNVERLVRAKDAWSADMRDLDQAGTGVPVSIQRRCWDDLIGKAEAAIAGERVAA